MPCASLACYVEILLALNKIFRTAREVFRWLSRHKHVTLEEIKIEVGDGFASRGLLGGAGQAGWAGHIPI